MASEPITDLDKFIDESRREIAEGNVRMQFAPEKTTWHRCTNGKIRPYSVVLCSLHKGVDAEADFDAVQEFERLGREIAELKEKLEIENTMGFVEGACALAQQMREQTARIIPNESLIPKETP